MRTDSSTTRVTPCIVALTIRVRLWTALPRLNRILRPATLTVILADTGASSTTMFPGCTLQLTSASLPEQLSATTPDTPADGVTVSSNTLLDGAPLRIGRDGRDNENARSDTGVPETANPCGLPGAFVVMVKVADFAIAPVGLNNTVTVQLAAGARLDGQLCVRLKSALPLNVTLAMVIVAVPEFDTVTWRLNAP